MTGGSLGELEGPVARRLAEWGRGEFARRLFERDTTLWPAGSAPQLARGLGWVDLPSTSLESAAEISGIRRFAEDVHAEGIADVVLLGMGGSSLAAEVFSQILAPPEPICRLRVLDTTHPDQISRVAERLDPGRALFIVASKSGGTLETLALYRYFWRLVSEATGKPPGSRFVAITDAGSSLDELARERGFRRVFHAPTDVGGRFSALSPFGLVPAALAGVDLERLLAPCRQMEEKCRGGDGSAGLALGAALGAAHGSGRDKLTLLTSERLASFADWADQLVAESLGKDGRGIVPVAHEPLAGPDGYARDRCFFLLCTRDEAEEGGGGTRAVRELARALGAAGHPVIEQVLPDPHDIGAEMYRWEIGVSAAAAAIGVEPFDQPDVESAKRLTRVVMQVAARDGGSGEVPVSELSRVVSFSPENDVDPRRISSKVGKWLEAAPAGAYLAIQAYLPSTPRIGEGLRRLQALLRSRTRLAVTAAFGPRYLHSSGQLHKGGPDRAFFLQLLDRPRTSLAVPETDYSFETLIRAQAEGDAAALDKLGRSVLRLELDQPTEKTLFALISYLEAG